jgi:hypothetical protein
VQHHPAGELLVHRLFAIATMLAIEAAMPSIQTVTLPSRRLE